MPPCKTEGPKLMVPMILKVLLIHCMVFSGASVTYENNLQSFTAKGAKGFKWNFVDYFHITVLFVINWISPLRRIIERLLECRFIHNGLQRYKYNNIYLFDHKYPPLLINVLNHRCILALVHSSVVSFLIKTGWQPLWLDGIEGYILLNIFMIMDRVDNR
jgi:hypothetical protein